MLGKGRLVWLTRMECRNRTRRPRAQPSLQVQLSPPRALSTNGIAGMDLFDLVEMLCDWMAAAQLRTRQTGCGSI